MGLLSIFKRTGEPAAPATEAAADAGGPVQRARARARQRLIGAVVLVAIGIIGFPLVFETQPRPIPVDIPIEIPRKDNAPPLAMPPARAPIAAANNHAMPDAPVLLPDVITESREDAGREVVTPPAAAPSPPAAASEPTTKPTITALPAPSSKASAPTATDGARAQALLEGKPAKPVDGRFVVQVGAFTDAGAAHETRVKVERLGLKTYTQVANVAGGSRIRVRLGPFASRAEADKALAKAKGAGLSSAFVQTL